MAEKTKIITKKVKANNRHWKNFIDKEYLGSHNIEKDEEMLLTIAKFEGEETIKTADGEKVKQVLYFKEAVPKMILNITNGNVLANLYGSHPDGWVGKQIQVYVAGNVKAFGKTQEATRIRDFKPKVAGSAAVHVKSINEAKTLVELGELWKSFPLSVKSDPEVLAAKDSLKAKLTSQALGSDGQ